MSRSDGPRPGGEPDEQGVPARELQPDTSELVRRIDECIEAMSSARAGIVGDGTQPGPGTDVVPWQLLASLEAICTARRLQDVAYSLLLERALNEGWSHESLGFYADDEP